MAEPQPTPTPAPPRGRRQQFEGVVVSDKMSKTVVVEVGRFVQDPRYGRYYRTAMDPLLRRVNTYLMRWAGNKYRRRLRSHRRFRRWWTGLHDRQPGLFAHWKWVRAYV